MSREYERFTQPIPLAPFEYEADNSATMRRQVEQNFEDLYIATSRALTQRAFVRVTENSEVGEENDTVLADATDGAITLSLPAASVQNSELCIKKIDATANTVTIAADGSDLIDGSSTLILGTQYDAVRIASDGDGWWIL